MKIFFTSIIAVMILLHALTAQIFESGGINYNVLSSSSPCEVEVISKAGYYSGSVMIPNQVTHNSITYIVIAIGQWAFSDCIELASVSVPLTLTHIGTQAFRNCTGLASITTHASTPPELETDVFMNIPNLQLIPLFVPVASVSLYQQAAQWQEFDVTGVPNLDVDEQKIMSVRMYPNPVNDFLNIEISEMDKCQFDVFDDNGRKIISEIISGRTVLPVNFMKQGSYIYTLKSGTGVIQSGKLLKQSR